MVRVERANEPSPSDRYLIRFRGREWYLSELSFDLESELRERFEQVSPEEIVEIRPPNSHQVLFLAVNELDKLVWE
ncbi:MAG TPA: hypothetical protein VFA17_08455 [Thermoplasmata archaeon]|jgi:hypothetical protein|nr:hypothetical protein [Thermoplasmata archaeon]